MLFHIVTLFVVLLLIVIIKELRDEVRKSALFINKVANNYGFLFDLTTEIRDYQKSFDENVGVFAEAVNNHASSLSSMIHELSRFVDTQQQQFNELAKAEMLSARREELRRIRELKGALERLMGVALTSRQPPAPNDVLALAELDTRIEELERIIDV